MAKSSSPLGGTYEDIDPVIPPSDESSALPRPANIGVTWKERESEAAAQEQLPLHESAGEIEARPHDVTAAETAAARKIARSRLRRAVQDNAQKERRFSRAHHLLNGYVNRPAHAELTYYLRLAFLLVGDVAGVSGAALLLGETYVNAFGQAASAAMAAVTLGAIGSETKRQRAARSRAADYPELPEDKYREYRPLFGGRTEADRLINMLVLVAAFGLLCIVGAIFSLRSTTEGSAAGFTFGLIALAVGLGSFINSYTTTCDVGEFLDRLQAELLASRARLLVCQNDGVIATHDGAVATALNVRAAWKTRGEAARLARIREKFAILNANPLIVGNGEAPEGRIGQLGAVAGGGTSEDAA